MMRMLRHWLRDVEFIVDKGNKVVLIEQNLSVTYSYLHAGIMVLRWARKRIGVPRARVLGHFGRGGN